MSKTTIRNLIIAVSIFVAVACAVTITFFKILKNSATLEAQIAAVAAQTQQEQAMLRLERLAQNSEEERAELASYFFFRESDSIGFLSEIESIAPTFDLSLKTTDLITVNEDNLDWVEATFGVVGARSDVHDFIELLENIPYVSRLTEINMTGETGGEWKASVTVQVQLLKYDE